MVKIPISKHKSIKEIVKNPGNEVFSDIKKPTELKKMKPRMGNKLNLKKFLLPSILIVAVILIGIAYWYISSQKTQQEELDKEINIEQEEIPEEIIEEIIEEEMVLIQETETGWLNVRQGAGISYEIITKVYPGESYLLLDDSLSEKNEEWYKIELKDGQEGWIFSQYATEQ